MGAAEVQLATLDHALQARARASEQLFERHAAALARLCHAMAERFARGGRLVAFGLTPQARTDVAHVVVEFVHPVIVGKRALPALGLTGERAAVDVELDLHVAAEDVVVAFGQRGDGPALATGVALARERGALTVAFAPLGAEHELPVPHDDPFVAQELAEVSYHVLWELVHVFFEHRGLLAGRDARPHHDAGPTAFLYPFLAEQETDLEAVLDDVARSARAKAEETQELAEQTVASNREQLLAVAGGLRVALDGGGRILTFGNGGSATDAGDLAVDLMSPVAGGPPRPALDLTQDSAVLTALGNDIGHAATLSRQLIAHAREHDALVTFSTSGGSENVLGGLAEARRRGLATVSFVGYDGGVIARDALADHVIVTPSQHIPRIQEAQATASHLVRRLIELVEPSPGSR